MIDYARLLRDAGLRVSVTPGWQQRSASGTPPAPVGVLIHHTAAPSSAANPAPSLDVCVQGRADLAGPLCHVLIGHDGTCHIIAAGRANHAGTARASGPNPAGDGNVLYSGIELDYSGTEAPSEEQRRAAVAATAAILRHLGRDAEAARGHRETSTTGKWDPGQVDLEVFRRHVRGMLTGVNEIGGIETMALNTAFHDWAGNEQDVLGWMNNVDRRLAALHHVILEPDSEPSRIPGDQNRTNLRDMIMDAGSWTHNIMTRHPQGAAPPMPDTGPAADTPPATSSRDQRARTRRRRPNRSTVAGGAAGAVGTVAVWIASLYGVTMPEPVAASIVLLASTGMATLMPERR